MNSGPGSPVFLLFIKSGIIGNRLVRSIADGLDAGFVNQILAIE